MALCDLADPTLALPSQLVLDTSFLLALRPGDDNPYNVITLFKRAACGGLEKR